MTLPSFLIIGAMKSGTTTLYTDLATHPSVSIPDVKEPGNLNYDEVLTPTGHRSYESIFKRCKPEQIAFDASTYYTMLPDYTGAARRALQLMGSDLRILYIVREPVSRIRSHHQHMFDGGSTIDPDINMAIHDTPELIEYSRYMRQLEPWLDCFGVENIMVIHFESYMRERIEMAGCIQRFLGLPIRSDLVMPNSSANVSDGKLINTPLSRLVSRSILYRRVLRSVLPDSIRSGLKASIMRKSRTRLSPPSLETVEYILDKTADDVAAITPLMNPSFQDGSMAWDRNEILTKAMKDTW